VCHRRAVANGCITFRCCSATGQPRENDCEEITFVVVASWSLLFRNARSRGSGRSFAIDAGALKLFGSADGAAAQGHPLDQEAAHCR